MQTLRYIITIVILQICSSANSQNSQLPYIVYNASKGVILKSSVYHEEFYPVRGTKLYEKDTFLLKDERYFVKIKDSESGEIYTFKGKGKRTPMQIVTNQRYNSFDKFFSFLRSIEEEIGFNTTPIRTSQCVTHKGGAEKEQGDSLSLIIASQINKAISDNIYNTSIDIRKAYSPDNESFYYSICNNDSIHYAIALYTVTKDNRINSHRIIVNTLGRDRNDGIAYIPLISNYTLNLDYFSIAADEEDNITCYVLLFHPEDFYTKEEPEHDEEGNYNEDIYACSLDWNLILKELIYQGNNNRVIYIKK